MRNRFHIENQKTRRSYPSNIQTFTQKFWSVLLFLGTLFMSQMASAQCQLNCIQNLQVSLNENCTALVTPNDILKSPGDCPGAKYVEILDKNNKVIPTNPTVTGDYIGQTLKVRVIHPASGNICWGNILIEDKLPPVFSNCKDYSLPCAMPIDQILATTAPTVADNCGGYVKVTRAYTKVDLGCTSLPYTAIVTVTTTAEDIYGNKSSCVQFINLVRSPITTVLFPKDLDDVQLPSLNCSSANTNPSNTGYPTLDGFNLSAPDCGYLVSYQDLVQTNCPGGYKILRTWTVMDWCGGTPPMATGIQVIKVVDKEGPVLNCNIDPHKIKVLSSQSAPGYQGCTSTVQFPAIQVSDNCSNYNQLTFLTYTYDSKGILYSSPTNGATLTLPTGDYFVYYNVTDGCGNVSFCFIQYEVKDEVPPVVACESIFNVSLTDSVTLVKAETFDDGSYDACSQVTFLARRMDNPKCGFSNGTDFQKTVPFYCCDINNGPVLVALRVLDAAGNYNDCMVEVTVNDKIKPVIWCPKDITVQCGADYLPTNPLSYSKTVTPNTTISDVFAKSYDVPVNVTGLPTDAVVADLNVGLDITHGYLDQLTIKLTSPQGTSITLFQGGNCGMLQTDINGTFDDEGKTLDCTGGNPAISGSVVPNAGQLSNFDGESLNSIDLGNNNFKNWVLTVIDNAPLAGGKINKVTLNFTYGTPLALRPYATDNTQKCGLNINWTDLDQPNNCQSGFIRRQWSATDAFGNKSSCTQRVYFIDNTPLDVIFPKDITIEDCVSFNDLANLGAPTHNGDCELVAVSKVDQIFNVVPDACYKIQRCWTIINWCKYDKNAQHTDLGIVLPGADLKFRDDGDGYFKYIQTIKIIDKVKPILTCPSNVVFGSYEPDCGPAFVTIDTLKWKDCTPDPVITYSVDYYKDGSVNYVGNGVNASGKYPNGTHSVTFKVSDKCGNFSTCSFDVTVKDGKKPTPVCAPISIPVMPSSGSITITPNMVNKSSYDNCTPANKLVYTLTPNTFTCKELGDNVVTLTVTDEAGNSDFCTTIVNIQDGGNICGNITMSKVTGKIQDIKGAGVGQVSIAPGVGLASKATTDDNGNFTFDLAAGGNYSISPTKNINPLNGVSTQDIVLISNHILGKKALNSPYKWVAADANKDNKVTTGDIVAIRKLILHITNDFPNNNSWRFIDGAYIFPTTGNPLSDNVPEVYSMNNLPTTGLATNFVGVKVGDVQGDAQSSNIANTGNDSRSAATLNLNVEEGFIKAGEEKVIDVKASDFKGINGYQFTLNLDNEKLEYVNILPGKLAELSNDNFGTRFANEGMITTSWNSNAISLADNDVLFSVVVKAQADVMISKALSISSALTKAEAYTQDEEVLNVGLQFTENGKVVATEGFEMYQNKPNPFSESTTVGFNLPEASNVSLTIYDMSGRIVKSYDNSFSKGYNAFEVKTVDLGSTGVFYYRIDTPTHSGTKKMVIVK
jgi:subtilisin-like proprotein convertase family protein